MAEPMEDEKKVNGGASLGNQGEGGPLCRVGEAGEVRPNEMRTGWSLELRRIQPGCLMENRGPSWMGAGH